MNPLSFLLSILVVSAMSVGQIWSANCHLKELDYCGASLILQLQNQANPTTDAAIDAYCGLIKEAHDCATNYSAKCATPLQKELFDFFAFGSLNTVEEFCTPGSSLRSNYLAHAKCLSEARDESKRCTNDLQVAVEELTTISWEKRIPLGCCAFNRFRDCSISIVKSRCGDDVVDLGSKVMSMSTSRLPETVCRSFPTKSPLCVDILPATGETPQGNKSTSLIARLFATVVGN